MKKTFTKEDAEGLGVSLTQLQKWEKVMNRLWHDVVDNGAQMSGGIECEIIVRNLNDHLLLALLVKGNDGFEAYISDVGRTRL